MSRPPPLAASPPLSPSAGPRRPRHDGSGGGLPPRTPSPTDAAVMRTNDDAAASKAAAAANDAPAAPRRAPMINRGTATRVAAVDALVATFNAAATAAAAAAIGSSNSSAPPPPARYCRWARGATYVEVDFPSVAAAKWRRLSGVDERTGGSCAPTAAVPLPPAARATLPRAMHAVPCGDTEFHVAGTHVGSGNGDGGDGGEGGSSGGYALLGGDLRDASRLVARLSAGAGVGWNWAAPTLLLTELVLVYMDAADSARLLAALAGAATGCLAVVNLEHIRPNDRFGAQMVTNIAQRGSPLRGLVAVPDLHAQVCRFRTAGWSAVVAVDMRTFYYQYLPPARRAHIESLELLDEVEEWHLLLEHYALVWGARDPWATGDGGGKDSVDDLTNATYPLVHDITPGQLASPFVAAFMLRPVPRQADAPSAATRPVRLSRLLGDWTRSDRRGHPRGGGDDLFPGAHLAGAE
ncbi:hypothetical protein MMPV_005937 [Pyropia vietnamensis]